MFGEEHLDVLHHSHVHHLLEQLIHAPDLQQQMDLVMEQDRILNQLCALQILRFVKVHQKHSILMLNARLGDRLV